MFRNLPNKFNLLKGVRNYHEIIYNRQKYLSPVLKTFEAYETPFIIDKGKMQYIWDIEGNKYIDMVSQNIVVSVGHSHPKVISRVIEQINTLPHKNIVIIQFINFNTSWYFVRTYKFTIKTKTTFYSKYF